MLFRNRRVVEQVDEPAPRRYGRGRSVTSLISIIAVVWLVIGGIAAFQRGYLENSQQNCASTATIVVTVIAGPLNYVGANPKIADCNVNLPQPSQ